MEDGAGRAVEWHVRILPEIGHRCGVLRDDEAVGTRRGRASGGQYPSDERIPIGRRRGHGARRAGCVLPVSCRGATGGWAGYGGYGVGWSWWRFGVSRRCNPDGADSYGTVCRSRRN